MQITKNSFINKLIDAFIGKGAFTIFSLLFTLIATRIYGIETFGQYTFAFTLVSILMILSKAGLDSGLIFSIPKTKNKYISLSLLVNFIFSTIIISITYVIIDEAFVRFMLPLIWLLSLEQIFFGIYRAEGKIKEFFFINGFLSMMLRVILIVLLLCFWDKSPYILGVSVYLSLIFSNLIYLYKNKNKISKLNFNFSFLLYSFTLVLANLLGVIMLKIDIIMLGILSTAESVGIYQIIIQVTSVVSLISIIFSTVFAPKISEFYHENNIEGIRKIYVKSTRVLSLIGIIVTILIIVFSELILGLFGVGVDKGYFALIFLSVGQFINIAVGNVWTIMAMTGKPKLQLYANIIAIAVNIVLNFTLIPIYGIEGAAIATLVTHFITNILGYLAVSKQLRIKAFKWI